MYDIPNEILTQVTGGDGEVDPCSSITAEANDHKQKWLDASQSQGTEHAGTVEAFRRYQRANGQLARCAQGMR